MSIGHRLPRNRWAIAAPFGLVLLLGGALWIRFAPSQYSTATTPALSDGNTCLRVMFPADWQVGQTGPFGPNTISCGLEHRAPTGLHAWIEEHIYHNSPADWQTSRIEVLCEHSRLVDLDKYTISVRSHPERGVVNTLQGTCALGQYLRVDHRIGRSKDDPERRDWFIIPRTGPAVTVFGYGSGKTKRATFQAADDIISRLRFVNATPTQSRGP